MLKNRIKQVSAIAISSVLAITLTVSILPQKAGEVQAARSVTDIQKDKDQIDSNLNSANSQLVSLMAEVQDLSSQITSKQNEISDTEVNLQAAQEAVEQQKEAIKERMKDTYESGASSNMLSVILGSKSISDFLNRVDYVTSVYNYDKTQLDEYQETVDATKSYQKQLQEAKATLESKQSQLSSKQNELNTTISSLQAQKGNIESELAEAQAEAARKAEEERKAREEAQRKANEEASRKAAAAAAAQEARNRNQANNAGSQTTTAGKPSHAGSPAGGNPSSSVNGSAVVAYAMQFVGNPYVWGGTSLTNGADCSGFVSSVFQHFGKLSTRYTSGSFRSVGQAVSVDNMQPGDIVCYSGHVAIYAGGGKIVEAQSTSAGITCNRSVFCHEILAIRRL